MRKRLGVPAHGERRLVGTAVTSGFLDMRTRTARAL